MPESHIRGAAVSRPRPQEARFTCDGQEGSALSWLFNVGALSLTLQCGRVDPLGRVAGGLFCTARPGPWLKRDWGSQFVPRLASWVSWKGLAPTSKPGCCSTRVVHTGCFFFCFFPRRCSSSSSSPVLDKSKIFCLKFYFVFSLLFMFAGWKDYFFSLAEDKSRGRELEKEQRVFFSQRGRC